MKRYPKYKDSGVEWLGKVPEHWETLRIKRAVGLRNERRNDSPVGWPYIGLEDVEPESGKYAPTENATRQSDESMVGVFRTGDVLYGKLRPYLRKAIVADQDGVCSTEFLVLSEGRATASWVHRWLLTPEVTQQIEAGCDGAKMPRADWEHVGSIPMPLPPSAEQIAISSALGRETARIDALIEKKTRFVELLKEKRQALITHAVTKGLDPNVRMKDSGVEWIGEVPENWEISKLAYTTREAGGKTPDTRTEAYWGGDVPWVSPKDMKQAEILDSIDKISDTAVRECGMREFERGTVLVVVRGMILAHSFPVAEIKIPATINQDMKALEPDVRLRPAYLRLLLETAKNYVVSVLVAEAAHGTKVLRADVWRQLPVLLPSIEVQDQILGEIRNVSAAYDKLTGKVELSIALLKERRAALITAAVTGQIDLREEAA